MGLHLMAKVPSYGSSSLAACALVAVATPSSSDGSKSVLAGRHGLEHNANPEYSLLSIKPHQTP